MISVLFDGPPGAEYFKLKGKDPISWDPHTLSDIQTCMDIGLQLPEPFVVVDIDNEINAEKLLNLCRNEGIQPRVMQTTRGMHFWFRSSQPITCSAHTYTSLGIAVDYRSWGKHSQVAIKQGGEFRQWITTPPWDLVPQIPQWLMPTPKPPLRDFTTMCEGSGRNDVLFRYKDILVKRGFSHQEAADLCRLINTYIFDEPLSGNELTQILRTEAWNKSDVAYEVATNSKDTLSLLRFDEIKANHVSWFWEPFIPRGKITLVQGDPGGGKTFLMTVIAAEASRGGRLPGQADNMIPMNVLFQNGEDGASDTIKPRLEAANANLENIYIVDETNKALSIQNIDGIREILSQKKFGLIIFDPLQQYLGASVDMHRANELRPVMAALARLADEFNCAVVIVMHMNKGIGQKAMYRGLGSIDLPAIARSVLMVGENQNVQGERLIIQIKSSLAPAGKSQAFTLHPDSGFCWKGDSDATEADLLQPKKPFSEDSLLSEAMIFVSNQLQDGPRLSKTLESEAKEVGISKRTFERARDKLKKEGRINCRRTADGWSWYQIHSQISPNTQMLGVIGEVD